ncbi:hypothetical protein [Parasediminibacterium sp. JCM 36343]
MIEPLSLKGFYQDDFLKPFSPQYNYYSVLFKQIEHIETLDVRKYKERK